MGIFTLFENTFDEVLLGDRDKHLDVVLSMHRRVLPSGDAGEGTLTTVVQVKNLMGRLYMLPVKPAHRIIAPAILARIADDSYPARGIEIYAFLSDSQHRICAECY